VTLDMTRVVPSGRMGDEEPQDEDALVRSKLLDRASAYLSSFEWCDQILEFLLRSWGWPLCRGFPIPNTADRTGG
jgi:hypothetical protein